MVARVQDGSAAEESGFEQGDIIQQIGSTSVNSMREFYRGLNETSNWRRTVTVNRGGNTMEIEFRK
jgi:S1-C subfamily serine protease